jgi:hypothetical protein
MPITREAREAERPRWIELERLITLQEAARLKAISLDTLRRRFGHLIVAISPRRRGMKLRDALGLSNQNGVTTNDGPGK